MTKIGILTIGQAPRADALAREVAIVLGDRFEVVERGALDGLGAERVAGLEPAEDDGPLVTLLADGTPVQVGKRAILAPLQEQVARLEGEDEVDATLLACTGRFPDFDHRRPLLLPQAALHGVVRGIAGGRRVATMPPLPEQASMAAHEWAVMGVEDVAVVTADPYGPDPHRSVAEAAREANEFHASVLFMDCFGFDLSMRATAAAEFAGPVILARSMAARLIAEIAG
jgi:protein AroM